MLRSVVAGCGAYLPERVVTNTELSERLDTSDEWIVQRTGIRVRHFAAEGELTSDLAVNAARRHGSTDSQRHVQASTPSLFRPQQRGRRDSRRAAHVQTVRRGLVR